MKKVLIVGQNAYLADGVEVQLSQFETTKVRRAYEVDDWSKYDVVLNFCIQPEHFSRLLNEEEMIDVQIAQKLSSHTKFVFMSSRKVYGSNAILKQYQETDELKPFDFYSKNKVNIENYLRQMLGEKLLILRTSNIIGLPPKHNSPTFMSWLESELLQNKKIKVTADTKAVKDFITKDYFQSVIRSVIERDLTGIYNVGAGFGITVGDLMANLVVSHRLFFDQKEDKGEQFILNCEKLHTAGVAAFTKEKLFEECARVKTYLEDKIG